MSGESFLNGRVVLHAGDCLDVLRALPSSSIDACVSDPPYALVSIARRFGKDGAAPSKVPEGGSGVYARASAGFMSATWDTGETAFATEFWAEVYRVLKPGGHVLAFSATRTVHRLTCAIEDAGFEIRDMLAWLYGSGFPKSHDVAKGIDKAAGAERKVVGRKTGRAATPIRDIRGGGLIDGRPQTYDASAITAPATDAARQWEGWGTALKPALEPITLARKPLDGTVAGNVLKHGVGALNIDGCRIDFASAADRAEAEGKNRHADFGSGPRDNAVYGTDARARGANGNYSPAGRFPANVLHDGEALPEEFARYFYSAKADGDDRIGSKHPTVKPVDLMRWLVRLVTPPGGIVLDPFAGTGTTGEAAFREGLSAVLVEREAEYRADIARRMELVLAGPDGRKHAIAKAKGRPDDMAGTLFAIPAPMAAE